MLADLSLPGETVVAVAGDWHGDRMWAQSVIAALHVVAPDVLSILHLGDFGVLPDRLGKGMLKAVDSACAQSGIERVLVTPGNHEDWDRLMARFASKPNVAVQLSEVVWVLPPGFRFALAGRSFLSFGGAASLDFAYRQARGAWWPSELPDESAAAEANAAGTADVLLTHETVNGGTAAVEKILRSNPMNWDTDALEYSALSRQRITKLWDGVHPALLAHGHMHVADRVELPDGRRVVSLGCNRQRKNIGLLNLADLAWTWMD